MKNIKTTTNTFFSCLNSVGTLLSGIGTVALTQKDKGKKYRQSYVYKEYIDIFVGND
jgi:hypothetical protein